MVETGLVHIKISHDCDLSRLSVPDPTPNRTNLTPHALLAYAAQHGRSISYVPSFLYVCSEYFTNRALRAFKGNEVNNSMFVVSTLQFMLAKYSGEDE